MGTDEITVGPAGSGDMIAGETGEHIQYALDTLAQRGGGVVRVRPGEYLLADSIYLKSGVDLVGTAGETVFRREGEVRSALTVDAEFGQMKLTVGTRSGSARVWGLPWIISRTEVRGAFRCAA